MDCNCDEGDFSFTFGSFFKFSFALITKNPVVVFCFFLNIRSLNKAGKNNPLLPLPSHLQIMGISGLLATAGTSASFCNRQPGNVKEQQPFCTNQYCNWNSNLSSREQRHCHKESKCLLFANIPPNLQTFLERMPTPLIQKVKRRSAKL